MQEKKVEKSAKIHYLSIYDAAAIFSCLSNFFVILLF